MDKQPIWYTEEQENEIQTFIQLNFGESDFISHELESEYVHTDTALIAPEGQSRTFVTFGMGARPMHSPFGDSRVELAICASPEVDVSSDDAFLLAGEVTHISKYPFREDTWLGEGHTINASEDFKERFGYAYFAFWDLGLSFRPAGMEDDVQFLALVPLYEEEREWIVNNDSIAFMYHLYDVYGDKMFCADLPRDVCIPDWDEDEQREQVLMRELNLNLETLYALYERMAAAEENGEEVTNDTIAALLEELR